MANTTIGICAASGAPPAGDEELEAKVRDLRTKADFALDCYDALAGRSSDANYHGFREIERILDRAMSELEDLEDDVNREADKLDGLD